MLALSGAKARNESGAKMATAASLGQGHLQLGSIDPAGGGPVAALQAELRRLQVLQPNEPATPGHFDGHTERAVRRMQWFAGQVPGALGPAGAFVARPLLNLGVDGVVGPQAKQFLLQCRQQGWVATGRLVKFQFDDLARVWPGAGYQPLLAGEPGVAVCAREFAAVVSGMDAAAQAFGVHVFVNQVFRIEGAAVNGAVVPPAGFSAHKIGRAIDLQLGMQAGLNPQLSIAIKTAAANTPFGKFRDHAKTVLQCRYGGDFSPSDPPHFDRQILPGGSPTWKFHHFFNQLQYRQALLKPQAIPALGAAA